METQVNKLLGVIVITIGMVGLYFKVEYSGWVVFLGALMVL